jgi:hypothetical protein
MFDDDPTTLTDFPEPDDLPGWINIWCRDDTGNLDCVPACLRDNVAEWVRPDGWIKDPDIVPNTPYKLARWFQFGEGRPVPPWIGDGITPDAMRDAWERRQAEIAAAAQRELDSLADLYFIQSGECGPIKIGITGMKIERRMKALQTAHPFKLRLLLLVKGEAMQETEYHARFADHRLEGEWFNPHPDILAEIERLQLLYYRET